MAHVLVGDHHVVLRCHVVRQVVIHDQAEKPVQQCWVHFLVDFVHLGLNQDRRTVVGCVPDVCEIVESLTPFVDKQRGRLLVGRLDPVREQVSLVGLVPQVLVQVGVCDLLKRLDVVHWDDMGVQVHELNAHLFEGAMAEEVAFDSRKGLVRVIIGLFNQREFFPL